jgi:zinc/manganese transport system ATP-binding protein
VLGPNGAGKSSLIKMLLGIYNATAGSVEVLGRKPRAARHHIGYIPQQKAFDRDVSISGLDLVKLGVNGNKWFVAPLNEEQKKQVATAIKEVGATTYAHKPIGMLSGGEQQRLRVAQSIVNNPQLLLCDEPLLSLDMASQQTVAELLNARRKKGAAIIFVTHEINPILPLVDRVVYIVGGKWAVGTPQEVLTSQRLSGLYGVPVEVLHIHGRIIVVSTGEQVSTEPNDTHHHIHDHESEDIA